MSGRRAPRPRTFTTRPAALTETEFQAQMGLLGLAAARMRQVGLEAERASELRRYGPEVLELLDIARAPIDLDVGPAPAPPRPAPRGELIVMNGRRHYDLRAGAAAAMAGLDHGLPIGWPASWPRPGNPPAPVVDMPDRSYPWSGPMDAVRKTQARRKQAHDEQTTGVTSSGHRRVRVNRGRAH